MKPIRLLLPPLAVLLALIPCPAAFAGPSADEIIMPIMLEGPQQALSAFQRGDIDVLPSLDSSTVNKLMASPNADIRTSPGPYAWCVFFNTRREPMKAEVLRQAVARIIDSNSIVREIIKEPALPMPGTVPQWSPFYNRQTPVPRYDPAGAKDMLDQAGYRLDPKTKMRIDPNTRKPLPELKILTDTSAVRSQVGKKLADACRAIGLPAKLESLDWSAKQKRVSAGDFDIHIASVIIERLPTSLIREFGEELDAVLEQLKNPADFAAARQAAMDAQVMLARKVPSVAFAARFVADAFRKDGVTGYVDMPGYGAANWENKWTKLSIRSLAGGAVRWPLLWEPESLNPCSNDYGAGHEVLSWIMDRLIEIDPETLEDVPWMAKEWNVGVWKPAPGRKGTMVTFSIRQDIKWHDGVPFTSDDIKFTIDYLLDRAIDAEQAWLVGNVVRVEAPDPYRVTVYFSDHNYWQMYDINDLWFLPKHIWKDVKDWQSFEPWSEPHPTVKGLTKLIGTGPFIFKEYEPGKEIKLVRNPSYWRLKPTK